jgi:catechol 2,3-dioxygenase-like lactoylglutathione lyase family enzyme
MRLLAACLLSVTLCIFPARGIAQLPPAATLSGIANVAIHVADVSRSRDFYQKLGFELAFTLSKDGTEGFLKVNDHQFIEMDPQQPSTQGFRVCFESDDLATLRRAYLARDLSPTPITHDGAGNLLFTLDGPEQQKIEYTQYVPGSLHSKDKGQHLGNNRISSQIAGVGLSIEDPVAARAFYEKIGFHESRHALEPGLIPLLLPGQSGQFVEITPGAFAIFLAVASVRHAAAQLNALHIGFEKQGSMLKQDSMLTVKDPDGNRIVFVTIEPETGRRLLQIPQIPWPIK